MRPAARERVLGAVARRVRSGQPRLDAEVLGRIESLEVAVAESSMLHASLADRVTRLEQDVLVVLRQRVGAAGES